MADGKKHQQPTKTEVAERIRLKRLDLGMSAKEVDRHAGLHEGHTSLIESGRKRKPTVDTFVKLAKALQCDLLWLMTGERHKDKEYEKYRAQKLRRLREKHSLNRNEEQQD
mgnify:FL=1